MAARSVGEKKLSKKKQKITNRSPFKRLSNWSVKKQLNRDLNFDWWNKLVEDFQSKLKEIKLTNYANLFVLF